MNYLYVLSDNSRFYSYGVGTYIEELVKCFVGVEDFCVNIVYLKSELKEFLVHKDRYLYIIYIVSSQKKAID